MENILKIDRSSLFEPVSFEDMGSGWFIEEQDERSIALTSVDLDKVSLKTMINQGEISVQGEEKLCRIVKAGYIRLDAKVFQTLLENQSYIPEMWKSANAIFLTVPFFLIRLEIDVLCICIGTMASGTGFTDGWNQNGL